MLVIPAVDIKDGQCVRLYMGNKDQETAYGDPAEMALKWYKLGAKRIHIVDLDGAFQGVPRNLETITEICQTLPIPVEVGGGIRSLKTIETLLSVGAQWVILGTVLVKDKKIAQEAARKFKGHVIAGIDAKKGKVAVRGWEEGTSSDALDLAKWCEGEGYSAIIYTDISKDGTLSGPNLEETARIAKEVSIPIIASGGVSCLEDVLKVAELEPLGVEGVIVGKALYDARIDLKKALESVGGYETHHPDPGREKAHQRAWR